MTLYVVQVPDPQPGVDWSTTVPGLKLWDVVGITGILSTGIGPTGVMLDSTGNGHDGTYNGGPAFVPSLIPGGVAFYFDKAASGAFGDTNAPILDWSADWSVEIWCQAVVGIGFVAWFAPNFPSYPVSQLITCEVLSDGSIQVGQFNSPTFSPGQQSNPGAFPNDGAVHQLGITFDAATPTFGCVLDGVAVPLPNGVAGPIVIAPTEVIPGGLVAPFGPSVPVVVGPFGLFPSVLSAGQFAAHYAARTSLTDFTAVALSDAPAALYLMNDSSLEGSRTPALFISSGTHIVELIGDGVVADPTAVGPYLYSWQPNSATAGQSNAGEVTNVALPPEVLPAGYVVGTITPDIVSTDQWSEVTVWWSDDLQQVMQAFNPYEYPPGFRLVYRQIGAIT